MILSLITAIYVIVVNAGSGMCMTYDDMQELQAFLLANYSKDIRPVHDQTNVVNVTMSVGFRGLLDFDVVGGKVISASSYSFLWVDEKIRWNPNKFANISHIRLPVTSVWIPTLMLGNGASSVKFKSDWGDEAMVTFNFQGLALYPAGAVLETTCSPDVTFYPSDKHDCFIDIGSQAPFNHVMLLAGGIEDVSVKHLIWDVQNATLLERTFVQQSFVRLSMSIERRATFLLLTLVLPLSLLTTFDLIVFVLPVECGERMSVATTILLTVAVYMTIMSNNIPNTSEPVAILAISLMVKFITCGLITILVALVSVVYSMDANVEVQKVPNWLSAFTRMARCEMPNCFKRKVGNKEQECEDKVEPLNEEIIQVSCCSWHDVGRALDKFLFVIFFIVISSEVVYSTTRLKLQI